MFAAVKILGGKLPGRKIQQPLTPPRNSLEKLGISPGKQIRRIRKSLFGELLGKGGAKSEKLFTHDSKGSGKIKTYKKMSPETRLTVRGDKSPSVPSQH